MAQLKTYSIYEDGDTKYNHDNPEFIVIAYNFRQAAYLFNKDKQHYHLSQSGWVYQVYTGPINDGMIIIK